MLELLQLRGLEDRYPREVSGGQQQRIALARAVVRRPRLLLLDEPLSALDLPTREQLRRDLRRLLATFGTPTLVVTHDRLEAIALADDVLVFDRGGLLQSGTTHDVFTRPNSLAVARIVGVETVEPARIVGRQDGLVTVAVGPAQLVARDTDSTEGDVHVCIRAEDVTLQADNVVSSSARNYLKGRITALAHEGPLVRVALDCGFCLTVLVTRPAAEELDLREGQNITAVLKTTAVHLVSGR
jgi:molybdate transport system ATP-binding protein